MKHPQKHTARGIVKILRNTEKVQSSLIFEAHILKAGSHFDISLSISRHTQTQYDVDKAPFVGNFPNKRC